MTVGKKFFGVGLGVCMVVSALLCADEVKSNKSWWERLTARPMARESQQKIIANLDMAHKALSVHGGYDVKGNYVFIQEWMFGKNSLVKEAARYISVNAEGLQNNLLQQIAVHVNTFLKQLEEHVEFVAGGQVDDAELRSYWTMPKDIAVNLWREYQLLMADAQKIRMQRFGRFDVRQKRTRELFLKLMPVITDVVERLQIEGLVGQEVPVMSEVETSVEAKE